MLSSQAAGRRARFEPRDRTVGGVEEDAPRGMGCRMKKEGHRRADQKGPRPRSLDAERFLGGRRRRRSQGRLWIWRTGGLPHEGQCSVTPLAALDPLLAPSYFAPDPIRP